MSKFVNTALEYFDRHVAIWKDLPDYIYTCKYKTAFYEFIKSRESINIEPKDFVLYVLNHENSTSESYFIYCREEEIIVDAEEVALCKNYYRILYNNDAYNFNKIVHTPEHLKDYVDFIKAFSPKKLSLFTIEYLQGRIILNY